MSESHEINVKKAILHVLDNNTTTPVLADKLMELDPQTEEFLKKHIQRSLEDAENMKGEFENKDNDVVSLVTKTGNAEFINASKKLAIKIFNIMASNPSINPADLLCCVFKRDGVNYFGLLKFNYKPSYIHQLIDDGPAKEAFILKQNTTIASESQKLKEFVFINLDDLSVLIKEKAVKIDEVKGYYLSSMVLKVKTSMSLKSKVNIIEKAALQVIKDFYGEDPLRVSQAKTELKNSIDENGNIDIDRITKNVFHGNLAAQKSYREAVLKKGLKETSFEVNAEIEKKASKKQKIVTDSGIEISLPVDYMENKRRLEFVPNADGTVSILIKSVNLQ